jgi:hypothetical protein
MRSPCLAAGLVEADQRGVRIHTQLLGPLDFALDGSVRSIVTIVYRSAITVRMSERDRTFFCSD